MVPGLCETIDYNEVQSVLFPRVAVRSFPLEEYLLLNSSGVACFHQNYHFERQSQHSSVFPQHGEDTGPGMSSLLLRINVTLTRARQFRAA